jgi:hypothetical protein
MKRGLLLSCVLLIFILILSINSHALVKSNSCMSITAPNSVGEINDFEIQIQLNLSNTNLVLMCAMQTPNTISLTLQKNLIWNVYKNESVKFNFTAPYNDDYNTIYFNCSAFNITDRYNGSKIFSCSINTLDQLSTVSNNGSTPAIRNNYNRVSITNRNFYIDGNKAFFSGVNWADWRHYQTNFTIVDQELQKMDDAGINYIRIYIEKDGFSPSPGIYSTTYKNQLTYLIKKAAEHDIFVELVPSGYWGSWVAQYYHDYWWSNETLQSVDEDYYYNFGKFLYDNKFNNILYISMMQEGSYEYDWYDPLSSYEYNFSIPGAKALAEAQNDWKSWLAYRNKSITKTMNSDKYEYANWINFRFKSLIKLRAESFRRGSNYSYYVGAQGGEGSIMYDYLIWDSFCWHTLKPDFWVHLVDVPEIHDYTPLYDPNFTNYWAYTTGFSTFNDVIKDFNKPIFYGEMNYNYSSDMDYPNAWLNLKQKMDFIKNTNSGGFGVWAWKDYTGDQEFKKWGFNDLDFNKRPILDDYTDWNYQNLNDSITLNLKTGLNFVSIPFPIRNKNLSNLINNNISRAYNYENGIWSIYNYNMPDLSNFYLLNDRKGYFLLVNSPTTIKINGLKKYYNDSLFNYNLNNRWNTIAIMGSNPISVARLRNTNNITEVWTFNGTSYIQMVDSANLIPGNGYWVYVINQ